MQIVRTIHLDHLENETYKPIANLHDSAYGSSEFCQRAERKVMHYTAHVDVEVEVEVVVGVWQLR